MGNRCLRSALPLLPPHRFRLLHCGLPKPAGGTCSTMVLSTGCRWHLLSWVEHLLALYLLWPWTSPSCFSFLCAPHPFLCLCGFFALCSISFPRDTTSSTDRLSCAPVGLLTPAGTGTPHTPVQLGSVSLHHHCKEQSWCQAAPGEDRGIEESAQGSWLWNEVVLRVQCFPKVSSKVVERRARRLCCPFPIRETAHLNLQDSNKMFHQNFWYWQLHISPLQEYEQWEWIFNKFPKIKNFFSPPL